VRSHHSNRFGEILGETQSHALATLLPTSVRPNHKSSIPVSATSEQEEASRGNGVNGLNGSMTTSGLNLSSKHEIDSHQPTAKHGLSNGINTNSEPTVFNPTVAESQPTTAEERKIPQYYQEDLGGVPTIPDIYKAELQKILDDFPDLFAITPKDLGRTNIITHVIDIGDHPPIQIKPYQTNPIKSKIIHSMVKELVDCGHVTPSVSEWRSSCP